MSLSAVCLSTERGAFCDVVVCSFDWFGTITPPAAGFILPVNPVNGSNGFLYVDEGTWSVLPKTPRIAGCCALSPSKKNPNTTSPGASFVEVALFPAPEPSVTPSNAIAQGRSSSGSSIVVYG